VPPWPPRRRWSDSSDLGQTFTRCTSWPKSVFGMPETGVRHRPKSLYGCDHFACTTSAETAVRFHPFCTPCGSVAGPGRGLEMRCGRPPAGGSVGLIETAGGHPSTVDSEWELVSVAVGNAPRKVVIQPCATNPRWTDACISRVSSPFFWSPLCRRSPIFFRVRSIAGRSSCLRFWPSSTADLKRESSLGRSALYSTATCNKIRTQAMFQAGALGR
jgi:hypothetical protein